MHTVINFFLRFTKRNFSTSYKILSMGPGIIIFLVLSPFVIFQLSNRLAPLLDIHCPRPFELSIAMVAFCLAVFLMSWALFELWFKGLGTAAPIAPTSKLVTSGPYRWCRNPIELGTNIYFLSLGIYFGSLMTGVLCMIFGLILGTGYIKLIEEKEMDIRFGSPYRVYLKNTPFMCIPFCSTKKQM